MRRNRRIYVMGLCHATRVHGRNDNYAGTFYCRRSASELIYSCAWNYNAMRLTGACTDRVVWSLQRIIGSRSWFNSDPLVHKSRATWMFSILRKKKVYLRNRMSDWCGWRTRLSIFSHPNSNVACRMKQRTRCGSRECIKRNCDEAAAKSIRWRCPTEACANNHRDHTLIGTRKTQQCVMIKNASNAHVRECACGQISGCVPLDMGFTRCGSKLYICTRTPERTETNPLYIVYDFVRLPNTSVIRVHSSKIVCCDHHATLFKCRETNR